MPIKVRCSECETSLTVSDKAAGRVVLCKSCGAKIRVPAAGAVVAPASGERPQRRRRPAAAEVDASPPAHSDELFRGLDLERAEDTKRRVCPSCANPVHVDDIECPKCGVTIATGVLSERQRKIKARKGPPPEEFYGAVWGNGWQFLKKHWNFAVLTAVVWSTTLSMSATCAYAYDWYIKSRTAELVASAEADSAVSIEGNEVVIRIPENGKARYDDKLYMKEGQTIRLPAPHLAAMRAPPAIFWMGMTIVFQLGFGGWAWMMAVKIAELTMSGQKKIKRFQTDFFANLTMGFRFYFWPVVLMIPVIWIGPALIATGNQVAGAIVTAVIFIIPGLLFLPAAVVHMTQRYGYRAWLINWMVLDFAKTLAPSLYIAAMMFFLVLLIPGAVAVALAVSGRDLLARVMVEQLNILNWLAQNVFDFGDGSARFLFYEMPLTFSALFISCGVLCTLIAFPSLFMMRVIGLYGVYFKPDLCLVGEFPDKTPAGFGPRFLAYLIDSIILVLLEIPAWFIGFLGGLLFYYYGMDTTAEMLSRVVFLVATLGLWGFYFASGESGQARATLGKWSLGLIVLREDDRPLTRKEAFGRAASAFVSALTLYIGFIMCAFRSDHKALHDIMSKSKVVWRGEEIT